MLRCVVPGVLALLSAALRRAATRAPHGMDPLIAKGFDLAYNLDHEDAIAIAPAGDRRAS